MVTTGDEFPGVYITREPKTEGVKLYGPFTSVYQLKEAITHLQKAFKFRTCHLEITEADDKRRFFRPCLLYAIHQCTAPCAAKIPRDAYAEDIKNLTRFLDGNRDSVLKDLEKQMKQASEDMHFERAARLRDEIKALQALGKRATKGTEQFWQPGLSKASTSPTCTGARWSARSSASSTASRSRTATVASASATGRGTTTSFPSRRSCRGDTARPPAGTSSIPT
jgi:excinuclease ABC subunit C